MILHDHPFFSIEECEEIKEYAYKKEKELRKVDYLNYGKTSNTINTNNFNQYNFFKDNPIYADRLVNLLRDTKCPIEWPILVQSWINIYRKGDGIGWHAHQGNSFSFNIFIDGDLSPGPAYLLIGRFGSLENKYDINAINFENKKGYIQIFPSHIFHKVDPVSSERISIGGTLHNYSDISKKNLEDLSFNNKMKDGTILLK
jgi:hypothetical protein